MPRVVLLLLAILTIFTPCHVPAQDTTYTLHGTVVDAITSKPIPRVLIASGDRRLATLTDSEGRFTLTVAFTVAIPKDMSVQLDANRPGYLDESIGITFSPPPDDLKIRLKPAVTLSGHLSAPGVDAARDVAVQLYSKAVDDHLLPDRTVNTDSHGDFTFSDLTAGDYTVGTSPWLQDDLYPPRTGPAQQYPPAYYGGSQNLDGALSLHLNAGASARADIELHLATYYPVHVPIQGKVAKDGLQLQVPGTSLTPGLNFVYVSEQSLFECWFQPGSYTLNFSAGREQLYGQIAITVLDAPLRTAPVVLSKMISIPVKLHEQYSHPERKTRQEEDASRERQDGPRRIREGVGDPVSLFLTPVGETFGGSSSAMENQQLIIRPLQPGTYKVDTNVTYGYVAALRSGSTDLLRQPLVLGSSPSPDPIEITIRDDGATIEATVDFGSAPSSHHAVIILMPTDDPGNRNITPYDGDEPLDLDNLAPGSYRVFAVQVSPGRNYPFQRVAALAALGANVSPITLLPNQHLTLTLPLIPLPEEISP